MTRGGKRKRRGLPVIPCPLCGRGMVWSERHAVLGGGIPIALAASCINGRCAFRQWTGGRLGYGEVYDPDAAHGLLKDGERGV